MKVTLSRQVVPDGMIEVANVSIVCNCDRLEVYGEIYCLDEKPIETEPAVLCTIRKSGGDVIAAQVGKNLLPFISNNYTLFHIQLALSSEQQKLIDEIRITPFFT